VQCVFLGFKQVHGHLRHRMWLWSVPSSVGCGGVKEEVWLKAASAWSVAKRMTSGVGR
jgi:hypothetical protein